MCVLGKGVLTLLLVLCARLAFLLSLQVVAVEATTAIVVLRPMFLAAQGVNPTVSEWVFAKVRRRPSHGTTRDIGCRIATLCRSQNLASFIS